MQFFLSTIFVQWNFLAIGEQNKWNLDFQTIQRQFQITKELRFLLPVEKGRGLPSSTKFKVNIEEKSFCHVAMLAKILDLEDREILLPW